MKLSVPTVTASLKHCPNPALSDELQALNRIVNFYLEFAELQALERKPMTMRNWIAKLDEFLKISGRKLLDHGGKVSHAAALAKAGAEYEKYRALENTRPSPVEIAFAEAVKKLPKPAKGRKRKP